jgi:sigma54-dependent transcription regulator
MRWVKLRGTLINSGEHASKAPEMPSAVTAMQTFSAKRHQSLNISDRNIFKIPSRFCPKRETCLADFISCVAGDLQLYVIIYFQQVMEISGNFHSLYKSESRKLCSKVGKRRVQSYSFHGGYLSLLTDHAMLPISRPE